MVEVLNLRVRGEKLYQTVCFDEEDPSWYETHLRPAEDLEKLQDSGAQTDFKVKDGLLLATPNLDTVDTYATPHYYKFQVSLVGLLRWLVEHDAQILLEDGTSFKALSMKVSSSTMTVSAPYRKDDQWRSFSFIYSDGSGLVSNSFDFVVFDDVPEMFKLGAGEPIQFNKRAARKYEYRGQLLVSPLPQDFYLIAKPMLHYLAARADMFGRIKDMLRLVERRAMILAGIVDEDESRQEFYPYPRRTKSGVSLKRVGAPSPRYDRIFEGYFRRYLQGETWTFAEVRQDLLDRETPAWEKTAKLLLTNMFFKYKQPEDRIQYISGMVQHLAERELVLRLALYAHRSYIYVNDIQFYEDSIEFPLDRLYLYGGTSKDYYVLKKE